MTTKQTRKPAKKTARRFVAPARAARSDAHDTPIPYRLVGDDCEREARAFAALGAAYLEIAARLALRGVR
jgi:hypothetical protein